MNIGQAVNFTPSKNIDGIIHYYSSDACCSTFKTRGRPPKEDMGRPKKKKPEEMTELELLQLRVKELEAENALLKISKSLSRSKGSPSQRDWAEAIQELRQEHNLEILLEKTGMARATFTIMLKDCQNLTVTMMLEQQSVRYIISTRDVMDIGESLHNCALMESLSIIRKYRSLWLRWDCEARGRKLSTSHIREKSGK